MRHLQDAPTLIYLAAENDPFSKVEFYQSKKMET